MRLAVRFIYAVCRTVDRQPALLALLCPSGLSIGLIALPPYPVVPTIWVFGTEAYSRIARLVF